MALRFKSWLSLLFYGALGQDSGGFWQSTGTTETCMHAGRDEKEREQDFAETTGGCRRDEEPSILWRICALRIFIRFELALDRRQLP